MATRNQNDNLGDHGHPHYDNLPIALRAFVRYAQKDEGYFIDDIGAWPFALVLDCETTTDKSQRVRFGVYQWHAGSSEPECGIFYDPDVLTKRERKLLIAFANKNEFVHKTRGDFVDEIFYGRAYNLGARIIGLNLAFDLSRLAINKPTPARGTRMRGGFTLQLSDKPWWPNVRVRRVSRKLAFFDFVARRDRSRPKSLRRKRKKVPSSRGYFIDLSILSSALLSKSPSLERLAEMLDIAVRKFKTNEHGKTLTKSYIKYAVQDVCVTWGCFIALARRYAALDLKETPIERALSEASTGKAHYREMHIKPWTEVQQDFRDELLGIIMSTFSAGRSEVHARRSIVQIAYSDFMSEYATVFALMRLWPWVIAKGVEYHDATDEVIAFLKSVTPESLLRPDTWVNLAVIVKVLPQDDMLPVRAPYGDDAEYTIARNRLTSEVPMYFTLADCVNSMLKTGRPPKVLEAIRFWPKEPQEGLRPMTVMGNVANHFDPLTQDLFKWLINRRAEINERKKHATGAEKAALDVEQFFLKIMASSTSYGIQVEVIATSLRNRTNAKCFGISGEGFDTVTKKLERPGVYFHPLIATFITSGGRLLLGLAERLGRDQGLDWGMCDTDSIAFVKPAAMNNDSFNAKVNSVVNCFSSLNPYASVLGSILEFEDENYGVAAGTAVLEPLYLYAVSAKRYCMFNIDASGKPVLRRISEHGLGHWLAPYRDNEAPARIPPPIDELRDIPRWEYDVWYLIVEAALAGHSGLVDYSSLPHLNRPAARQYTASTFRQWLPFKRHNAKHSMSEHMRPFNFALAFQAKEQPAEAKLVKAGKRRKPHVVSHGAIHPIAPYHRQHWKVIDNIIDRDTGKKVSVSQLATYADVLATFHLHPEAKFKNADMLDNGMTEPRHIYVRASDIRYIGKEMNDLEEQVTFGVDPGAVTNYGTDPRHSHEAVDNLVKAVLKSNQQSIADEIGVSRQTVSALIHQRSGGTAKTWKRIKQALLTVSGAEETVNTEEVIEKARMMVAEDVITVRGLARMTGIDPSNLSKILNGKRQAGPRDVARLAEAIRG